MFFKPQEDPSSIAIIKFYCGSTCLYFPLLTIIILCTDLMYETGHVSFLPVLFVILLAECVKFIFMMRYFKESEKQPGRCPQKTSFAGVKKWVCEKRLKDFGKSTVLLALLTLAYFVISVLFGAEFLGKTEETFMFSLMLSILTALPPCLHLGPNFALTAILGDDHSSMSPLSPVLQHVFRITLFGTWLGAFVIPLDWDRPWQEWPVPCCVGALMGYVASHATAMLQVAMPDYVTNKLVDKLS